MITYSKNKQKLLQLKTQSIKKRPVAYDCPFTINKCKINILLKDLEQHIYTP